MNAQSQCVFPDTLPKDELLFPLVQFFAEAVYIGPAENDLPSQNELSLRATELLEQGVLRFHCPAPLGADQESFLRLLNDLRQRPSEYAGFSLAGLLGNKDAAESKDAIISAVRRQSSGTAEPDGHQASLLWQARLVLKLGEIIERQEKEIRQSLQRLARQESSLLQALRADQTATEVSPALPAESNRTRLRLKAWRTLLAFSKQPLPARIFVTADQDAFDLLLEESGAEVQSVLALPLPAVSADGKLAQEQRAAFHQATAGLTSELPTSFDQQAWEELLEQYYPTQKHGRCRLSLHFLPSIATQKLFGRQAEAGGQGTVLGMLLL